MLGPASVPHTLLGEVIKVNSARRRTAVAFIHAKAQGYEMLFVWKRPVKYLVL